jgi:hypothetical protein
MHIMRLIEGGYNVFDADVEKDTPTKEPCPLWEAICRIPIVNP